MIVFVRHGQTAVNRDGQLQGRVDSPLTELGRTQAMRLVEGLRLLPVARVLSSPLQRALETAAPIAHAHGVPVEVDERLVELDYGTWDQREVGQIGRDDWERWRADPGFAPPGGESLLAVRARISDLCEELAGGESVVAVSHVSPVKAAVCWALGVDERTTWRMHLDLASITRIERRADGRAYLVTFNETAHLR